MRRLLLGDEHGTSDVVETIDEPGDADAGEGTDRIGAECDGSYDGDDEPAERSDSEPE
jgi:hypothetical protein